MQSEEGICKSIITYYEDCVEENESLLDTISCCEPFTKLKRKKFLDDKNWYMYKICFPKGHFNIPQQYVTIIRVKFFLKIYFLGIHIMKLLPSFRLIIELKFWNAPREKKNKCQGLYFIDLSFLSPELFF